MALSVAGEQGSGILTIQASGKPGADEYSGFFREFERQIKLRDRVGLLLEFNDFAGFDLDALSSDLALDLGCLSRIKRMAVVGERKWEEWINTYCSPFMGAAVRCFQPGDEAAAKAWLAQA